VSDRIRLDSGEEPQRTAPDPAQPAREESPPPSPTPEPAEQETSGESPAEQQPEEPSEAQRRLDRLTREKYEAQRQRDELAAMLQAQRQQQQQLQYGQPQPADPVEAARQDGFRQAHEAQIAERFNQACNGLFQRGQTEFGDMPDAVSALNAVGYGSRPDVLAALTELPDGHRVYRQLAGDLDNAARVLTLNPMQMALELARMSQSGTGTTSVSRETPTNASRAPAPLRPVGGNSAAPRKRLDQMTMAEFIRERERGSRTSKISR
jgi:hypothetical protein